MLKHLFSIYDEKTEVYSYPFQSDSKAAAVRQFRMMINNEKYEMLNKNPEDFSLWYLGEFNDSTGKFSHDKEPAVLLCKAVDLVDYGTKDEN